eukprot:TRINITY_DN3704_c0_g1_i1.p1 TRINITY_DN3704_c0_g1~~TRINITY_DN3704_c0_g1_i1.p1  ORF type:complete len:709 (-),score=180.95 TRINITY_DN3704_c0_g1_i1:1367-3493(-)
MSILLKGKRKLFTAAAGILSAVSLGVYGYNRYEEYQLNSLRLPNPRKRLPSREEQLKKLQTKEFDILVIGGGSTGSGIALDAASRGLKVAMVEREDFASGTSSRSTKLIHGGVRYLEKAVKQLDWEQFQLVREALHERKNLLKIAPHLSYKLPIMLPIPSLIWAPYYWVGTKLYDLVSGNQILESSYFLSKSKALEKFPMLREDSMAAAMVYYDGAHDDARMNVALALTAAQYGASIANYTEVVSLVKKKGENGRTVNCGAIVKDTLTGNTFEVKAKGIINATGPFTDTIRQMSEPTTEPIVTPSSGVHITLPDYYSPQGLGLVDPSTSDGRVLFFLPWQGYTIVGTTDTPCKLSSQPSSTEEDIQFILHEIANYLSPDLQVRRGDVKAAWAGIRPLVRDPNAKNTESISRNHVIEVSDDGLITIAGGKWTTYRTMALDAVDKAIKTFKLKPKSPCLTERIFLIGGQGYSSTTFIQLIQKYGLDKNVAEHLANSYGDKCFDVASLAEPTGRRWPVYGKPLAPGFPYLEEEVRYVIRNEYARTAEDILARRLRIAFLDVYSAYECLPRVINILAEELGWDENTKKKEFSRSKSFLFTMGLDDTDRIQDFNANELVQLREAFHSVDSDADGHVSADEFKSLVQSLLKISVTNEELDRLISEVDKNKNGQVEFNEFLELMSSKRKRDNSLPPSPPSKVQPPISTARSGGGL